MMDWSFPPELQELYNRVVEQNKRLQLEMGIKSRTIAERAADYARKKEELAKTAALVGKMRPPPKWKV